MKTRTLLILVISIFSLATMIVFAAYINNQINKTAEEQFDSMISGISEKQSRNIDYLFEYYRRTFQAIAGDAVISDFIDGDIEFTAISESGLFNSTAKVYHEELISKTLSGLGAYIHEENTSAQSGGLNVYAIAVYKNDKEIVLETSAVFGDVFNSSWFSKAEDGVLYVCSGLNPLTNTDYKLMSKKQIGGGYSVAVIFNPANLKTIFSHSTFPINGRIILIDPNKQLLDDIFVGNLAELNMPEYNKFKEKIVDNGFLSGSERFTYQIGRNERIAYLTNIGSSGWLVGVFGEGEKAYTYSGRVNSALLNCVIFLGIFMLSAGIVMIIFFTKPLRIIQQTLMSIRKGDHEARINIVSNNEYGDIASAFNDLMDDVIVSESRYRTIIEMSDNIIFEWNLQTNQVYFSANFNKKFSYRAPSDSFEDSFLLKCKVHPEDSSSYKDDLDRLARGEQLYKNEYRWKNIYGDYIWVLLRTATIKNMDNEIVKVVGVIVDIDRAKKSEKMLTLRASYDALTGLYNRETVESLINNEIDLVDIRKNEFAILFIDVDDFKQYNDNYSHATGDQVLQFTASTIRSVVDQFGIAGRFGGDEFVVCVRNSEINDPANVAQEMLNKLKDGFVCDVGERLSVAVSIGIAVIHNSNLRVDEIIGMADDAMYKIKKSGKSNYGFIIQD